jgi:hypothetical protein
MALTPVVRWHAIYSAQGGGAIRIWTQEGAEQLSNLSAEQFAAYMSVLKQDQTVLYNPDNNVISSGPETP